MKAIGVIPARFKSSRYPGKPLADILGKPMIIHVAEKAAEAMGRDNVYVATEDQRIFDIVTSHGFHCVMTTDKPLTGTDRIWEVAQQIQADIYINIQGDEPVINPKDILAVLNAKKNSMQYIINGMCALNDTEHPDDINIPKVLVSSSDMLIYMSRLPIPGIKDAKVGIPVYKKQVCIYAFTYEEIKAFGLKTQKAEFEKFEDIEILRFLDMGFQIKMVETHPGSIAVDNPEDIAKVVAYLTKK